jgi:hypothetical protein
MSAPNSPPRSRGPAFTRRAGYSSSHLRISDAERAEVVDRLSKHYSEGRLDQAEFNQRVDQATRAKTRADLHGLFADLPETEESGEVVSQPDERPQHHILLIVLVIVIAAAAGRALMATFSPWWLVIGLLAFLFLHYGPARHRG